MGVWTVPSSRLMWNHRASVSYTGSEFSFCLSETIWPKVSRHPTQLWACGNPNLRFFFFLLCIIYSMDRKSKSNKKKHFVHFYTTQPASTAHDKTLHKFCAY